MSDECPERTMVVWCADWPVAALEVPPDEPAAVVMANRVVAASAAARAATVGRGMRRREAQGRCPDLVVLDRDELREVRAFEAVARAVEMFSPRLEILRPGVCALGTRGPSRYFGGDWTLARQVHARVADVLGPHGLCRIGVADGVFASGLAARLGHRIPADAVSTGDENVTMVSSGEARAFLEPLPISVLGQAGLADVLIRLGLETLGAFASLEPSSVIGRFGRTGLDAHRLARGLAERPLDARQPPPDLRASSEIDPPAERVEQVAFLARELAEELHTALDARGLACTRVAIEAETESGEHLVRLWRHEGALSAGAIADRARWQLDGWLTAGAASRATGGIVRVSLVPDEVLAAQGRQMGFWGEETEADRRAARALARLASMLGAESVLVPERAGGRGPGDAIRLVPAVGVDLREREIQPLLGLASPSAARARGGWAPWPGRVPPPTPTLVHDPPVAAVLADDQGGEVEVSGRGMLVGVPTRVTIGRAEAVGIVAWAGPWMFDERWWEPGAHRRVARLQVQDATGSMWLLSRERERWWVEATYD